MSMKKITDKVKKMPWPSLVEVVPETVRWLVSVNMPVIDGERVLVVTFTANPSWKEPAWRRDKPNTFRLVVSKKVRDYRFVSRLGAVYVNDGESLANGNITPYTYIWIDDKDEAMLKRFTGAGMTANHYIDSAWNMAKTLREKKKREASVAKGEIQPEDVNKCREEYPEGFEKWILRDVIQKDHTLIYKKGNVRGLCYLCGNKVKALIGNRFSQNGITRCPYCGNTVTTFLEDSRAWRAENVANVAAFQKGEDGILFIRCFRIWRSIDAEYESLKDYVREYSRIAIRGTSVKRWTKLQRHRAGWSSMSPVEEAWAVNWEIDKGQYTLEAVDKLYTENIEREVMGTSLEYARVWQYSIDPHTRCTVKYAICAARYPIMEFLYKGGYTKLVSARVGGLGNAGPSAIRWTGKTVKECFKFPVRWLKVKPSEEWGLDDIMRCNELYKANPKAPMDEVDIVAKHDISNLQEYRHLFTYKKVMTYLSKMAPMKDGNATHGVGKGLIGIYADYLKECTILKLDLSDRQVLYPPDLQRAHERTSQMVSYEQDREAAQRFAEQARLLQKWSWQKDDFVIRPAMSADELKREGAALHHCVGGYADKMANGETAIFLVRKHDEPYTPYYTLELRNKRVIQCRTYSNRTYEAQGEEAVKAFIDAWMTEVVNKPDKKKTKPQATTAVA